MKVNYQAPEAQNLTQYLVGSGLLFVGSLISETAAISILSKVMCPSVTMGLLNAGFVSGIADTGGRSLGNIMIAIFTAFGIRWLPTTLYGFYAVVTLVFFILTWINYDELQKLVYVQIITTENEKMLKEKKKQRILKLAEEARSSKIFVSLKT
jgi:ABC-type phosphate transport system permease subunit